MNTLMIYGATGYTGRMAAAYAKEAGLALTIAGRDGAALAQLAATLGVQSRAFALDVEDDIVQALDGVTVLLNCAGPFYRTAGPLMRACVAHGVHYLDVAAELDSYQLAGQLDDQARAADVMLLPGSGGSVAMLGSLVRHVIKRVAQPQSIAIALHVSGGMSRGSLLSATENMTDTLARVDGELVARDAQALRDFDFGHGPVSCFPVTLPDLITLWRDTQVSNIDTFVHISGGAFPQNDAAAPSAGPTDLQRAQHRYQVAVDIVGIDGTVHRAVLDTVNGYTFTPMAAVKAAQRVLAGEVQPGFQTPTGLFGEGFVLSIADSTISDGQAILA